MTVYGPDAPGRIIAMVTTAATAPLTRRLFTVAEVERMIAAGVFADDERSELIDGEVVMMAAIGRRHAECVWGLARQLTRLAGELAEVNSQNPLALGDLSRPEPDVMLLRPPFARY